MDAKELDKLAKELAKKMRQAAAELNFEEAVRLRLMSRQECSLFQ